MKVPLLQKGKLLLPFISQKETAEPVPGMDRLPLVHLKEGTGQKRGVKQHEYCT